jgi:hypothetical protein
MNIWRYLYNPLLCQCDVAAFLLDSEEVPLFKKRGDSGSATAHKAVQHDLVWSGKQSDHALR